DTQPPGRGPKRDHQPARQCLGTVVEQRPERRGPCRLNRAGVLGHVPGRLIAEQVEIAVADVRICGWSRKQLERPAQRGRQLGIEIGHRTPLSKYQAAQAITQRQPSLITKGSVSAYAAL